MTIVMASDTCLPRINGVSVFIRSLGRCLEQQGHRVVLIGPDYPRDQAQDQDFETLRLPSYPAYLAASPEDRLAWPWCTARVGRALDRLAPDIVHVHTEFSIGCSALAQARRRGIPAVATHHTYFQGYIESYVPRLLRQAVSQGFAVRRYRRIHGLTSRQTVPTAWMKQALEDYAGIAGCQVIPSGIDPGLFAPAHPAPAPKSCASAQAPRLLHVGRLAPEKNLEFLLAVLACPGLDQARLTLVGDGPAAPRLRAQVQQLRLEHRVSFAGPVPPGEVVRHYQAADIFVCASRTETQNLTVLEAMACGVPVVAIAEKGLAEVMAGDRGGLGVPADPASFARAVLELSRNQDLYRRKSAGGREHSARWSIQAVARQFMELYSSLTGVQGA